MLIIPYRVYVYVYPAGWLAKIKRSYKYKTMSGLFSILSFPLAARSSVER